MNIPHSQSNATQGRSQDFYEFFAKIWTPMGDFK